MKNKLLVLCLLLCCTANYFGCDAASPRRLPKPWEGETGAEWRKEFEERFGKTFEESLKDPTTVSSLFPTPSLSFSTPSRTFSLSPLSPPALSHNLPPNSPALNILERAFERTLRQVFVYDLQSLEMKGRNGMKGRNEMREGDEDLLALCDVRIDDVNSAELTANTNESYTLSVGYFADRSINNNITITANNVFGVLHAFQSLANVVVYNFSSTEYSCIPTYVADEPRFPFRGVMVDIARNFVSISALENLVDVMAIFKLNALQLHLTDDQSWPLEILSYPRLSLWGALTNYSHTYSQSEMRQFAEFARDRGVRIIPEIDLPGHSSKLCQGYPDLCALWVDDNNVTEHSLFDPTNEDSWKFATQLYKELSENIFVFSDEFHLGGDEVWTVPWERSVSIQAWLQAHSSHCPDIPSLTCGTVNGLLHYFTRRQISLLRSLNKRAIGWAPGINGFNAGDSGDANYTSYPDVTLDNWDGFDPNGAQYWQASQAHFSSANGSVVLSGPFYVIDRWPTINDGTWLSWHDMYHTDPANFTGTAQQKKFVRGGKVCIWDDAARTDSQNLVYRAGLFLAGTSEALWAPNGTVDPTQFPQDYWTQMRIRNLRCRLQSLGFLFEPAEFVAIPCAVEFAPQPLAFEFPPFEKMKMEMEMEMGSVGVRRAGRALQPQ